MKHRLRALWLALQGSLWFVPTLIVAAGVALALALIEAQLLIEFELGSMWPRLFGAGAEGSRGMLSAIATSMITVAGVVFSITIVALSLAASQYSPRVLRHFMADRTTQVVLGTFVSIYVYCLIVLRTIRSPGEEGGGYVPSVAVFGGVVIAFVGVGLLIYFIHHVATSIQVSAIVGRIAEETLAAIDRLYPEPLGEPGPGDGDEPPEPVPPVRSTIRAPRTGNIVSIDAPALLELAVDHDTLLRIVPCIGDFIVEGEPLVEVCARRDPPKELCEALPALFTIERQRTIHQDAPYGVQQLVDIALKALSPGIHDPTTAIACIDQIGALLVQLSRQRIEGPWRCVDGRLRVVAPGPDYDHFIALAFDAIADHAADHVEVLDRLLRTLQRIAVAAQDPGRRAVLVRHLDAVLYRCEHPHIAPLRRGALRERGAALRAALAGGAGGA